MLQTMREKLFEFMCKCGNDSYWGDYVCFACGGAIPLLAQRKQEKQDFLQLMMPGEVDMFAFMFEMYNPWKNIPLEIAEKYGWYFAEFSGGLRLVMPVWRGDDPVFYSARLVGNGDGLKYMTPHRVKKHYWISTDDVGFPEEPPIFFCEGVADAAYMSLFGSSVALLGVGYDGSLDEVIKDRKVVICFDGDVVGRLQANRLGNDLTKLTKCAKILILDEGTDPTDLTPDQMKKKILETLNA